MRVLVWQWGRRGAMPRIAAELAKGLASLPGVQPILSLSTAAEILQRDPPPINDLPMTTYRSLPGCLLRLAMAPWLVLRLIAALRRLRPDMALCVDAGPLDPVMVWALRVCGVRFLLIVHEATPHAGDRRAGRVALDGWMRRQAAGWVTFSSHVTAELGTLRTTRPILCARLPPLAFAPPPPPPGRHGGPMRFLFFGRLLAYKGLDLLAEAVALLDRPGQWELRVIGLGDEGDDLGRLRSLPGVVVENRWVAEAEIAPLLAWADALVLPYREASQSGVAAAAMAARRYIVATSVGGLAEQLGHEPLARMCAPNALALAAAMASLIDAPPPFDPAPATTWQSLARQLITQAQIFDLTILRHHR